MDPRDSKKLILNCSGMAIPHCCPRGNCVKAVDGLRSASKQKLGLLVTNSLDQLSAKAVDDNCDHDCYFFPRCIQSLRTEKIMSEF